MRKLAATTVLLVALIAPATAQAKPVLGIADNKASTFVDQRFLDLNIKYSRINIPWDVLADRNSLPAVDQWMLGAKLARTKPLVSFDRSRISSKKSVNPSPAQLAAALKAWRARWPGQVSDVSAWNEPNINGKSASRVAKWWLALRKACPKCTVLPGELVDRTNAPKWAADFIKAAKRKPKIWALHAYIDANNFSTKNTKAFLKATQGGKLWLTETGGVVRRTVRANNARFAGQGVSHQTKATEFLLSKVAKNKAIERIYIYSWSSVGDLNWDSGLVGPAAETRPALNVVRKYLGLAPVKV